MIGNIEWSVLMEEYESYPHPMKMSIIEHNPSALRGWLNNPKWYAYGHRLKW